jgi:hypothetical protein
MKNDIARLNDLSNDLLMDIFDYLDVFDLFRAFVDLNARFRGLIVDRRLSFQAEMIALTEETFSIYQMLILPRVGQYLRYLSISDEFGFLGRVLQSTSLGRLQSVRLSQIKWHQLTSLLSQCRLRSMEIRTSFIQNEKHLAELFHHLFTEQVDLRSIRCSFSRPLHFVEEKTPFSRLQRLTIDDPCFSSDLIVLISQLPFLRYLNAQIDDDYREEMDRDIEHLEGSQSIRSAILHVEHVKCDRLLLVISLMPDLNRLELNGSIGFDIQQLIPAMELPYQSFHCHLSYRWPV